jgi:hypothetical protein
MRIKPTTAYRIHEFVGGSFALWNPEDGVGRLESFNILIFMDFYIVKLKVKQSRYRPGVAQKVPGS